MLEGRYSSVKARALLLEQLELQLLMAFTIVSNHPDTHTHRHTDTHARTHNTLRIDLTEWMCKRNTYAPHATSRYVGVAVESISRAFSNLAMRTKSAVRTCPMASSLSGHLPLCMDVSVSE